MCLNYYNGEESNIRSIILYGSAAKNFAGNDQMPGDFDLNMFFSDQADVKSTYGMPKIIGEYDDLEVEVMRNKVSDDLSIEQFVESQDSKRWQRIKEEPTVQIYPTIEQGSWE